MSLLKRSFRVMHRVDHMHTFAKTKINFFSGHRRAGEILIDGDSGTTVIVAPR